MSVGIDKIWEQTEKREQGGHGSGSRDNTGAARDFLLQLINKRSLPLHPHYRHQVPTFDDRHSVPDEWLES
jgi:hypothetical protein